MLSEEARARLNQQLAQMPTEQEEATPESPESDSQETQPDPEPPREDQPEPQETKQAGSPQGTRMVPVEEVAKLRQDRRTLRDELSSIRAEKAKLEGYIEALNQRKSPDKEDDAWLKELDEETNKPDPIQTELQELKAWKEQVTREKDLAEGKILLEQVCGAIQKQAPDVPRDYLLDAFAQGKEPEAAVAQWRQWHPTPTPTTPVPTQTKLQAPPVVRGTPTGKPDPTTNKPRDWKDVQAEVRRRIQELK